MLEKFLGELYGLECRRVASLRQRERCGMTSGWLTTCALVAPNAIVCTCCPYFSCPSPSTTPTLVRILVARAGGVLVSMVSAVTESLM
jgi:hypothetical protein